MKEPTREQIETTQDVLTWLQDDTIANKPWATELLSSLESVINSLPEGV